MCGSDEIFNQAMATVTEWLDKGPKHLALAITELIHAHRYEYEPDYHVSDDPDTRKVMRHQWRMGDISLIWGFFHTDWKNIIDEHLHGTRRSGARWLAILQNRCGHTEMILNTETKKIIYCHKIVTRH